MAKKGGFFQTIGRFVRWIGFGLAAVLVLAIWMGWSNQANGPMDDVAAVAPSAGGEAVTEASPAEEMPVEEAETAAAEAVEAGSEPTGETGVALREDADRAVDEVQSALESAVGAASEATGTTGEVAAEAEATAEGALEGGPGAEEAPASELEELAGGAGGVVDTVTEAIEDVMESPAEAGADEALAEAEAAEAQAAEPETPASVEGAVTDEEADFNVLPAELSEIRVPGDEAVYGLVSVFQRDDGSIEVVSSRTAEGAEVMTTRLVTCAPLAVGVIAEGDGPRTETPEMERIVLGSAAATIAALACGAMN